MSTEPRKNRRTFPRRPSSARAVLRLGKFGLGKVVTVSLIDLSSAGLCMIAAHEAKVDEELELELVPKLWGEKLTVPAKVRSVRASGKGQWRIGCEFLKRMTNEKLMPFFEQAK